LHLEAEEITENTTVIFCLLAGTQTRSLPKTKQDCQTLNPDALFLMVVCRIACVCLAGRHNAVELQGREYDHFLITVSMEQCPSSKVDSRSASKESFQILWNMNVHYRVHKIQNFIPLYVSLNMMHHI
jgi:hypothetical protein